MRSGIAIGDAAGGTHETLAVVAQFARVGIQHLQQSVALLERYGHCLSQPRFILLLHTQAVDDHFDVVVAVPVQLHLGHYLAHLTIDAHIEIALAAYALKEFTVMSLAVMHQRRQDAYLARSEIADDQMHYLLLGIFGHRLSADV